MPASNLIQCAPAVALVNWIQSDWFIGQQGALLVPSRGSKANCQGLRIVASLTAECMGTHLLTSF